MKNVVLIGMPGSGKSTVGVVLAKVLGYRFIDSDLVIQEAEGKLLHEIISERGIEGFLEVENKINSELNPERSVIATGGSVIYGKEAMEHLSEIGTVVYLKLPYDVLVRRLGNLKDRGVVLKEGQTLKGLYEERTPLYEKYAQLTVDEETLGIRETVELGQEDTEPEPVSCPVCGGEIVLQQKVEPTEWCTLCTEACPQERMGCLHAIQERSVLCYDRCEDIGDLPLRN